MPKFRYLLALLLLPGVSQAQSTYLDTLPTFWRSLYPQGGSTLYCEYAFKPFDRNVNVEHVFPMSWVTRELRCGNREQCRRSSDRFNQIESDMHNMYPSLKQVNRQRGAYAYDNIKGEQWSFKGCDIEISQRRVEPAPSARGEIARAMLYMSQQYDLR
ncbi:MAG: endonuclease, partial [bacterium]